MKGNALRKAQGILSEKTLVLLKPDSLKRGLVGRIVGRFEDAGLKLVGVKLIQPTRKLLDGHFPQADSWVSGMGEKTLEAYTQYNLDPHEIFGTADPMQIGLKIKEWNYAYLMMGPVLAMVLEGVHSVDVVRKMIGNTLPFKALPGTIRGDFSVNAPDIANIIGSACKNLVHASGNQEEAAQEVKNWFAPNEIVSWETSSEFVHFLYGEHTTENPQL